MAYNKISGQITVTTAGTAVAGPDTSAFGKRTYSIEMVPTNSGTYGYVGNDGANDVASTTGYIITKAGVPLILVSDNLAKVYFDTDTNGDKFAWVAVESEGQSISPSVN